MDSEVIIIGSGPAGIWLAYNLAQSDIEVLILEKEPWPRYKACGGAISGKTLELLHNKKIYLPDSVVRNTINKFTFNYNLQECNTFSCQGQGIKLVNRKNFDDFLLKQSCKAGANFYDKEKVIDIEISKNMVEVFTEENSYKGKIVVGADGAWSKTGNILNLYPENIKNNMIMAVELELFKNDTDYQRNNRIEIDIGFIPGGYVWIFPKKNRLSIGLGTNRTGNINLTKQLFAYLRQKKISYSKDDIFYKGYPIPLAGNRLKNIKMAGNRFLLIGDAAYLADPLVGEGIYNACFSAEIAANTIIKFISGEKNSLLQYQKHIEDQLYFQLKSAAELANIFYKNSEIFKEFMSYDSELFKEFFDVIQGRSIYSELFGQIKSFPVFTPLSKK
ncbi:NAD(P)/FAD-dependent oxidoreductase [Halarsenatibacter silvermanii]|nr:NAD(P)/FAD-dependent oxidoreductase [Halarsenatibacter silvermanii]